MDDKRPAPISIGRAYTLQDAAERLKSCPGCGNPVLKTASTCYWPVVTADGIQSCGWAFSERH